MYADMSIESRTTEKAISMVEGAEGVLYPEIEEHLRIRCYQCMLMPIEKLR